MAEIEGNSEKSKLDTKLNHKEIENEMLYAL